MNKTYKLENKSVELTADEIRKLVKDNPEIMKEEKGERYFRPEKEIDDVWFYFLDGEVVSSKSTYIMSKKNIDLGVYKTEVQATYARDRQLAIVRVWHWFQDNCEAFEPHWSDIHQTKYCVVYSGFSENITGDSCCITKHQTELPYFKTEEDRDACIKACEADLKIIFNVK